MAFGKAKIDLDAARASACGSVRQTTLDQAERRAHGTNVSRAVNALCALSVLAFLSTGVYAAYPHVKGALAPDPTIAAAEPTKRTRLTRNAFGGRVTAFKPGDEARVRAMMAARGLAIGRMTGKRSCDDFSPKELKRRQEAHWARVRKGQDNPMALARSMQSGVAMGDVMAVQCGFANAASKGRTRGGRF